MNILVLENDTKELTIIQQTLSVKHNLIPVSTSEQAWEYIQAGEARFLIASWDTSDIKKSQFINRVRGSTLSQSVYILLITSKSEDELPPSGMDDTIQRPIKMTDLKTRVTIAERIISLTNSLTVAREQLESQAVFDDLTGFSNRAAFLRQSTGELERSRRASIPLSLIALDIDNFKLINDTYGIQVGDEVLKIISQVLREKSRPYDCIGRWAGDEFVLALPGVIGADAEKISERIIAGVRGTRIAVKKDATLNVKVSAGIASLSRITTSTEISSVIEQARQAMSRAKESGGNQIFLIYS